MNEPLVAQVLWTLGRAGAERIVFELARALPERGLRSIVIAAGGSGAMKEDFQQAGIECVIGPRVSSWRRWQTIAFLKDQLKKYKPAVWHAHLSEIWACTAWRGIQRRPPFMITAHNDDKDDPWARHQLRGWAFRQADQVVCISDIVRHYVKHEFKVKEQRLRVIRNGIDLERTEQRPKGPFHRVAKLIAVGRLAPQKDHTTLLKALAMVKAPWELEIVGDGPDRVELQRLALTLGIEKHVTFSGSVDDVPQRLAQADLFCFPSRWEGQGIALLEAMAAGVPAIASDLPIFREIFNEDSLAFAKPQAPSSWARVIQSTIIDPATAFDRAERARHITEKEFALNTMVDRYAELYRKLV